jgi:hypothetical protein
MAIFDKPLFSTRWGGAPTWYAAIGVLMFGGGALGMIAGFAIVLWSRLP